MTEKNKSKTLMKHTLKRTQVKYLRHDKFICDLMSLLEVIEEQRIKTHGVDREFENRILETNIDPKTGQRDLTFSLEDKLIIEKKINVRQHTYIIYESHFCYMHALFEKFLSHLLINRIKSNKEMKEKYSKKFNEVGMTNDYRHLINFTDNFDQKLSRINDVVRASEGIINLCKYMFGVKKLGKIQENEKNADYFFHAAYTSYIEMRELNNLLKHRGNEYDEEYVKKVGRNLKLHSQKIDLNKIFEAVWKGAEHLRTDKVKKYKNDAGKSLIGKRAFMHPIYFEKSIATIIYISEYLIYKAYSDIEDKSSYINSMVHNLLLINYKMKSFRLSQLISTLCKMFGHDFEEMPKIIQFNKILADIREYRLLNEKTKPSAFKEEGRPIPINRITIIKKYNKVFKKALKIKIELLKFEDGYKTLLKLYHDDKKKEFINHCFSMDLVAENFESWSLFQDFRKDDLFLSSFKKKFKKEYTPNSFPIPVHMKKEE